MNDVLTPAQASAQLISLIVLGAMARWYVVPWLNGQTRADALTALLWVHVFRYVALQVFSAQRDGFPISDGGAMEIVIGDVAGAVIAFITIALLRRKARLAIALAWLLATETAYDTVANIHGGVQEPLMGAASGVHLDDPDVLCADGGGELSADGLATLCEEGRATWLRLHARPPAAGNALCAGRSSSHALEPGPEPG